MKPPLCEYCHKRFSAAKKEGGLVRFANYQTLPKGKVGHPKGLGWFCKEHLEAAKTLSHYSMKEALEKLEP